MILKNSVNQISLMLLIMIKMMIVIMMIKMVDNTADDDGAYDEDDIELVDLD